MKCKDIIGLLEKEYPKSFAEDWDNIGLIAGDGGSEVNKILVALDATDEVVEQAVNEGVDMLVTHHPLIFGSIKQINDSSVVGRRLLKLIGKGIAYYALHTNFDVKGMAKLNEEQIGLINTEVLYETGESDGIPEGIGRVGELQSEMSYMELARHVKKSLGVGSLRCYGKGDPKIKRVAISGGAGRSVVDCAFNAGAQVLITGDIDYHTGIDAAADGLHIIDAGHFGTECVFMDFMSEKLKELLPQCRIIKANQAPPFVVV